VGERVEKKRKTSPSHVGGKAVAEGTDGKKKKMWLAHSLEGGGEVGLVRGVRAREMSMLEVRLSGRGRRPLIQKKKARTSFLRG